MYIYINIIISLLSRHHHLIFLFMCQLNVVCYVNASDDDVCVVYVLNLIINSN